MPVGSPPLARQRSRAQTFIARGDSFFPKTSHSILGHSRMPRGWTRRFAKSALYDKVRRESRGLPSRQ